MTRRSISILFIVLALAMSFGYFTKAPRLTSAAEVSRGAASVCPPAPWHTNSPENLQNTLLPLSHILVRHDELEDRGAPLTLLDWQLDYPAVSRTREEAIALAVRLRQRILDGDSFERIAMLQSDDPSSKARMGRLGVFPASELMLFPKVLDCLAAAGVGKVTRLVESPAGVHIFRLDEPPRATSFELHHLVIGHRDAPFLTFSRRGVPPEKSHPIERTREEALKLADAIWAQRQERPFQELIEEYSEHSDAEFGGSLGTWSSWEALPFHRVIDLLLDQSQAEPSRPVDTEWGVQLFVTQPALPVEYFAARVRFLPFDPSAQANDDGSIEAVKVRAETLLKSGKWKEASAEVVWGRSRGPVGLEPVVEVLSEGEFFSEPVRSDFTWAIGQRMRTPPSIQKSSPTFRLQSADEVSAKAIGSHL